MPTATRSLSAGHRCRSRGIDGRLRRKSRGTRHKTRAARQGEGACGGGHSGRARLLPQRCDRSGRSGTGRNTFRRAGSDVSGGWPRRWTVTVRTHIRGHARAAEACTRDAPLCSRSMHTGDTKPKAAGRGKCQRQLQNDRGSTSKEDLQMSIRRKARKCAGSDSGIAACCAPRVECAHQCDQCRRSTRSPRRSKEQP